MRVALLIKMKVILKDQMGSFFYDLFSNINMKI